MNRFFLSLSIIIALFLPHSIWAQQSATFKSFNIYTGLVPGVDFFASKKQLTSSYQEPVTQVVERLNTLLGKSPPKGAIFICSTLEQKDSIYEPMILKMGYSWTLSIETADIQAEEMMARIKSMMGDDIPAEIMDRMSNRQPAMIGNRMIQDTVQKIAYAVIQTSFAENLQYRSSRLNDMGKSPLPDWLDIGIGVYATGEDPALTYLKQNMEQTFPIEDVLTMSRPFVASMFLQEESSESGGGMFGSGGGGRGGMGGGQGGGPPAGFEGMGSEGGPPAGFGGGGRGSSGGEGAQRGGPQRTIPKDEQDQMIFDGQSSTFFAFLLEKVGMEKIRELIDAIQAGTEGRDFIARSDMLGDDYGEIEEEWLEWAQDLKTEPAFLRSGMPRAKEDN